MWVGRGGGEAGVAAAAVMLRRQFCAYERCGCTSQLVQRRSAAQPPALAPAPTLHLQGFTKAQLEQIMEMKKKNPNARVRDYKSDTVVYVEGRRPWEVRGECHELAP